MLLLPPSPTILAPTPALSDAAQATAAAAAAAVSGSVVPCEASRLDHLPWPDTHTLAAFAAEAEGSAEGRSGLDGSVAVAAVTVAA